MDLTYSKFLAVWQIIALSLSAVSFIVAILILIIHKIRFSSISDYKQKYDYLASNDSRMVFMSIVAFAVGLTLIINTVYDDTVAVSVVWFFVRMFIALCIGTLIIYISYLMMRFAYPTTLEKKMKKWRYKPRVNSKTGHTMKLLSEDEEDVHLDEGMQAEENVFSVDYDVWVDEETGDVQIEKYPGHLIAYQCNSCGFKTMKLIKEEIVIAPTEHADGEMIKNYQCNYCSAKRSKTVKVAKLSQSESHYKLPAHLHFKNEEKVDLVSLEIHISTGKTRMFEFNSTKQASEFLKEFKVEEE
ncbi:MAG: hypothetical protein HC819_09565 [Cyclobacteriaceae bacterium]|nr:hypothetical protein [Cyclobacteriaceae bacterium]